METPEKACAFSSCFRISSIFEELDWPSPLDAKRHSRARIPMPLFRSLRLTLGRPALLVAALSLVLLARPPLTLAKKLFIPWNLLRRQNRFHFLNVRVLDLENSRPVRIANGLILRLRIVHD